MERHPIAPEDFACRPVQLLSERWMLLGSGDGPERWNAMTVSWGGFGVMWAMPIALVTVRPSRHTYSLLAACPDFTLMVLPEHLRPALDLCGHRSGRDGDKFADAGLTPRPAVAGRAPDLAEAELCICCRTVGWVDLQTAGLVDEMVARVEGPPADQHRWFAGRIIGISGTAAWS